MNNFFCYSWNAWYNIKFSLAENSLPLNLVPLYITLSSLVFPSSMTIENILCKQLSLIFLLLIFTLVRWFFSGYLLLIHSWRQMWVNEVCANLLWLLISLFLSILSTLYAWTHMKGIVQAFWNASLIKKIK